MRLGRLGLEATFYKRAFSVGREGKNQSTDNGLNNEASLTKSSSFNVGRGMADVRPAFLFVAAMVFVFANEKMENLSILFNLAQQKVNRDWGNKCCPIDSSEKY